MENRNEPTLKANKGVRFYNPGDRFSEPLTYSIDGADIHTVARYPLDAPEKDFFYIPTELRLLATSERIPVDFATTVCQKFKDRGLIMIDEEWEPAGDDEDDKKPFARTDKEAVEKGDAIWSSYLWTIVRRWKAQCESIKRNGGVPEEASGFTKRALKILGMRDPAHEQQQAIQSENSADASKRVDTSNAEVESLKQMVLDQNAVIEKFLSDQAAREEAKSNASIETHTKKKRGH